MPGAGESAPGREPLRAEAEVEEGASGFALVLRTGAGKRELAGRTCAEVAGAAALILALLIDPEADAAPRETPAEPERTTWLVLRPELALDTGILPSVAVGPALALGVKLSRLSLELSGTYLPAQDVIRAERDQPVAQVSLLSAALGACYALVRSPELGPCLRIEHGRLLAEGQELPGMASHAAPWSALWLGARAGLGLTHRLWATLELAVGLPLLGATFTVDTVGTVHQTGDVAGRLRAGVEVRL
jgi:hypothetical protein